MSQLLFKHPVDRRVLSNNQKIDSAKKQALDVYTDRDKKKSDTKKETK